MPTDEQPSNSAARGYYENRIRELDQQLSDGERLVRKISMLRGIVFFVGVAVIVAVWNERLSESFGYSLAGAFGIGFLLLVGRHERTISRTGVLEKRRIIQRVQLARMDRKWTDLSVDAIDVPADRSVESNDLNLFGKASLFQLMSRCNTPVGIKRFSEWLMYSANPKEVLRRQVAVQHLLRQMPLLEELDLRGRMLVGSDAGPVAFTNWAESEPWLGQRMGLLWTVRVLTLLVGAAVAFWINGMLTDNTPLANGSFLAFCGLIVISVFVNVLLAPKVHEIFSQVNSRSNDIEWYRKLFEMVDQLPDDVEWLRELKLEMRRHGEHPLVSLNRLARIMKVANLRLSPFFGLLHIGIQLVSQLDFHTLQRLEKWQQTHGNIVRYWFDAVGRFEAISSVATLAHDNPSWTYPSFSGRGNAIIAAQVGHPLLASNVAVVNDTEVGPPGSFLLVTGSNMSGKSTLLRAVGVNAVLAQMGAPVFSRSWSMPPVIVHTSMRVQDSLEDGVSFFMAELKRLKTIVDRSVELKEGEFGLLYLLDEILQGTNSIERHIAVAQVIRQLVANESIGIVSTHDLELSSNDKIINLCKTVHFREQIVAGPDGDEMTFDYKMRRGLAPSTNALKLLEMVGLSDGS